MVLAISLYDVSVGICEATMWRRAKGRVLQAVSIRHVHRRVVVEYARRWAGHALISATVSALTRLLF